MSTSDDTTIRLLKCCTKCGEQKPATLEYYGKRIDSFDGLRGECRICSKANKRAWYEKNREHACQYSRVYVRNHYEETLSKNRQWRQHNPDKCKTYNLNWKRHRRDIYLASRRRRYQLQKEHRCAEARAWRKNNPEKVRIQWKVRQARKRSSFGNHTTADIKRLYTEQEGRCFYCGITLHDKYHVDHIQPLSRGGSNAPENLACACEICNLSKYNRTLDEWKLVRGW